MCVTGNEHSWNTLAQTCLRIEQVSPRQHQPRWGVDRAVLEQEPGCDLYAIVLQRGMVAVLAVSVEDGMLSLSVWVLPVAPWALKLTFSSWICAVEGYFVAKDPGIPKNPSLH
uniref:Uncharacterized protein n=1 Tax=Eutreptiella gymnastica TaxID=73025 RepID=A0A7S1HUU9_9EUGL|mmetsp:Transcript_107303/g.185141  ORF Transcript_107303/g.185141 Transcript_107303/m.185141 type:complete len:113 (+) Transcript_107303:1040-1378(+)